MPDLMQTAQAQLKTTPFTTITIRVTTRRLSGIIPASLQLAFPKCMHVPHMVVK